MHHKLALPVLLALCIASFGTADAKSGPNWGRNNRAQPPAAKRQIFPRDDVVVALVNAVGVDDPSTLTNGPEPTTTTTSTTSTSPTSTGTESTSTTESSSSTTTSDSTSITTTTDSTSPTSTSGEESTTAPTTTPASTTGNPLSSILSEILNPSTASPTETSDTLTLIGSPTEDPTTAPTTSPTEPPTTTDAPTTDTTATTTTGIDITSIISSILSSLTDTDTSTPTDTITIIGTDGPTTTDTSVPTTTTDTEIPPTTTIDTGVPPTTTPTDTAGPTGPTDTVTTDTNTVTTDTNTVTTTTSNTTPFDPNQSTVFPTPTTTLDPSDASTVTAPDPTTIAVPSQYEYLNGTVLALTTTATTSIVPTGTDPDAPSTVSSIESTAVPSTIPVFPANLPLKIVPSDTGTPPDQLAGYTQIMILFDVSRMPWSSVLNSPELAGQIFAFFNLNIAHALGLQPSQVITTSLSAYAKVGWSKDDPNALAQLATVWNGQMPTDYVQDLTAQLMNQHSPFYTGVVGIPAELAHLVVPTFTIVASNNGANGGVSVGANTGGTTAPSDTSKNTIIGVTTTVGVILVLLIVFFLVKMYKRSRESAHRRLSGEPMTGPAMRSYGSQGFSGGPIGGGGSMGRGNRDSFFFAEDSLRGYQHDGSASVEDDDSYTSHQPSQARRAPIQASAISQPILRESSMGNW